MNQYSFVQLIAAHAKHQKRENYDATKVLGMTAKLFFVLLVLTILFWIAALVILIVKANDMPAWAVALCVILLFFATGGPVISIVLCFLTAKRKQPSYSGLSYSQSAYSPRLK